MSAIHYKFRSAKEYDTYKFDGAGIPVWELKNEIIESKKLGKSEDFDLVITNAQTNEDYSDDSAIIPRNTSVVIKRVPVAKGSRPRRTEQRYAPTTATTNLTLNDSNIKQTIRPSASTGSKEEDEKIARMMSQSTLHWVQSQQQQQQQGTQSQSYRRPVKPKGPALVPPPSYTCFRCGQSGHYINYCPTNADPTFDRPRIKKTTGIPKAFLKSVDPSRLDNPSAAIMITSEGAAVIATPNETEWERVSAERLKSAVQEVPEHLTCVLCKDLVNSPMTISCCKAVFCDDCITQYLTENDADECPVCKRPNASKNLSFAGDLNDKILMEKRRDESKTDGGKAVSQSDSGINDGGVESKVTLSETINPLDKSLLSEDQKDKSASVPRHQSHDGHHHHHHKIHPVYPHPSSSPIHLRHHNNDNGQDYGLEQSFLHSRPPNSIPFPVGQHDYNQDFQHQQLAPSFDYYHQQPHPSRYGSDNYHYYYPPPPSFYPNNNEEEQARRIAGLRYEQYVQHPPYNYPLYQQCPDNKAEFDRHPSRGKRSRGGRSRSPPKARHQRNRHDDNNNGGNKHGNGGRSRRKRR